MKWNEFITQLLKDYRISTVDLENKAGVNNAIISNLKTGRTQVPSQLTIKKIEDGLNIKIDDSDPDNITYTKNDYPIQAREPIIPYGKRNKNGIAAIPLGSVDDINIGQKDMNELLVYTVNDTVETELYSIGDRVVFAPQEPIQNNDKIILKLATGVIVIRTCMILDDMILVFRKNNELVEVDKYNNTQIECMYKVIGKIS